MATEPRIRTDDLGRTWVTVDRDVADRLLAWSEATWTEITGMAHGYTATAGPGHDLHDILAEIHAATIDAGDELAFVASHEYLDARLEGHPVPHRLVSTCGIRKGRDGYSLEG